MEPASSPGPLTAHPPDAFVEEVRAALDHLYDSAFLHNHPLARRLCAAVPAAGIGRAQRLRTQLLNGVEQLRPEQRCSADAMRAYALLTYRCVDGLSMDEIATRLGLSRRQTYREYAKGVEAVAGFVWDTLPPPAEPAVPVPLPAPVPGIAPTSAQAGSAAPGEVSRLDAAAQEVSRLTRNLLTEAVELPALVHDVAKLLAPRTTQTGVALHIEEAAPLKVAADRSLLRQALLNLLSNALDQAHRGGQVTVTCHPGEHVVLLWVTTGAGEPPARRQGVGMSVAQKLVEAMGGEVQVVQTANAWRCSLALPTARSETVLVVDDNSDLTTLFQRYTAGWQLTVVGATNSAEALALAQKVRPQLILLDLMLSPVDGWEILQQLRACPATQRTPIVICSVINEPDLAFSLGASDYVTKPISQATLVDVLQRWLGKQHPAA